MQEGNRSATPRKNCVSVGIGTKTVDLSSCRITSGCSMTL